MKTTLNDVLDFIYEEAENPPQFRKAIKIDGPPSTGKTQGLNALLKGRVAVVNCANLSADAPFACPAPDLEKREVVELLHTKFKELFDLCEKNPKRPVGLFFDEYNLAHKEVKLVIDDVLDRRVMADRPLPANVVIILAGNSKDHSCGTTNGAAKTARRMLTYEIDHDPAGSMEFATKQGWHPDVLAYLAMKPAAWFSNTDDTSDENMVNQYREASRNGLAFACSSGWEHISRTLKKHEDKVAFNANLPEGEKPKVIKRPPDIIVFAACVGSARAAEFAALRGVQIPSHADLLEQRSEIPEEVMAEWMCIMRLAQLLTPGNSSKTCAIVRDRNPEMVGVFLKVAGRTAMNYLKTKGVKAGSPKMALIAREGGQYFFPGFSETLLASGSRYAASLEVS